MKTGSQSSISLLKTKFYTLPKENENELEITNAFSPQGVTFDHASIFDVLGAL